MNAPYKNHPAIIITRFLIIIGMFIGVIYFSIYLITSDKPKIISPLPDVVKKAQSPSPNLFIEDILTKNPKDLKKIITDTIGNKWPNYSVLIVDFKSDVKVGINENQIFTAASVNKIPILAGLYYLADKKEIDLDSTITTQSRDIQDYGTGSIRYDPVGTVYSLKTLARLMIQKSDNTAAYLLASSIITVPKLQEILHSWGLNQTDIDENKTSNSDIYEIFRRIYDAKIISPAYSEEMLTFMKGTDFEDRLPLLLPQTATIYHKIGTEVGVLHDAGIVTGPKSTYYIGVFTLNAGDEQETADLIGEISKKVFDYMEK